VSRRVKVIGRGRAGGSIALALSQVAGWDVRATYGRYDDVHPAAHDTDVLVVAVPDAVVEQVAAKVEPCPTTLVVHVAGSLGLDVLHTHPRRASLHPLVPLPDAATGARKLIGSWMAVAGDSGVSELAEALSGRTFVVDDAVRTLYHAAAAIASNHLVALLGQVQRLAEATSVPFQAYLSLASASLDNVGALGAAPALTGPVAREDWDTVRRHLAALPAGEVATYRALVLEAARLADKKLPADLD
jgi:predicted short-subunit dehydrogenase-like oxidoreductase (DUF2520 family)